MAQAQRLGAEFLVPLEVNSVLIDAGYKRLTLSDGRELVTRTILAATGMAYREHPAPGISEHTGAGVYYGASTTEAPVFAGRCVVVVGGGNSAGQSAIHLSRYAKEVQVVVRRDSLRAHHVAVPHRPDRKDRRTFGSDTKRKSNVWKETATWKGLRSSR